MATMLLQEQRHIFALFSHKNSFISVCTAKNTETLTYLHLIAASDRYGTVYWTLSVGQGAIYRFL